MESTGWNLAILNNPDLSPTDKLVYHLLESMGGDSRANRRTVAEQLGLSERSMRHITQKLSGNLLPPKRQPIAENGNVLPPQRQPIAKSGNTLPPAAPPLTRAGSQASNELSKDNSLSSTPPTPPHDDGRPHLEVVSKEQPLDRDPTLDEEFEADVTELLPELLSPGEAIDWSKVDRIARIYGKQLALDQLRSMFVGDYEVDDPYRYWAKMCQNHQNDPPAAPKSVDGLPPDWAEKAIEEGQARRRRHVHHFRRSMMGGQQI